MDRDPLLERIVKLKEQDAIQEFERRKKIATSNPEKIRKKWNFFATTFNKLYNITEKTIQFLVNSPILGFIVKKLISLVQFTINLWLKYSFQKDEYGQHHFKPIQSFAFVTSLVIFWFMSFIAIDLIYYTTLYALTSNIDETVYMTNSQEVDPLNDIYSAQGCETLPCDQESSIYFRVDPILFNHLYSLVTEGNIFYPDYVAAAVPPSITKCTITSYGIRWKTLMRRWDIYPYLLRASCQPIIDK